MNDLQNDIRRSMGLTPERTVQRILHRTGHVVTEGQIETAGKTYTKASVATAALLAVIDAGRVMGRTLWRAITLAAAGLATLWVLQHLPAILAWTGP